MNPVVYLSVELKARDMDSRLLIAAEAIKRDMQVVFGQQWVINKNYHSMPKGAVLFKTVNEIQASLMEDAARAGHIVAASDEEALACACNACFESGMGPTAAKTFDIFFAQSPQHASAVTRLYPKIKERVRVTGNPRIDLLKAQGRKVYQAQADQIRTQMGKYVLFNTNFGWINSIWNAREDAKQIAVRSGHLVLDDPESVAAYEAELEWERSNMAEMENVIAWMEQGLPFFKAVIRPHPAEDSSYWKTKYGDKDHVIVAEGTPHIPWTLGAEALVHTTCSTGMEAALMGVPALSITPTPNEKLHSYLLTNSVNPTCPSSEEACAALSSFFENGTGPLSSMSSYTPVLDEHFPEIEGAQSASIISDEIVASLTAHGAQINPLYRWDLNPGIPWVAVDRRQEWKDKFSLEAEELVTRLQAMSRVAGLEKAVNAQKLDDSLFLLFGA